MKPHEKLLLVAFWIGSGMLVCYCISILFREPFRAVPAFICCASAVVFFFAVQLFMTDDE